MQRLVDELVGTLTLDGLLFSQEFARSHSNSIGMVGSCVPAACPIR